MIVRRALTASNSNLVRHFSHSFGHDDKLVIVTGGANGIGRSICEEFARDGAHVLCVDIDHKAGEEMLRDSKSQTLKGTIRFHQSDLSDRTQPSKIVETALGWKSSPVGVLVNNVGIQTDNNHPVHALDEEVWDKVLNLNLKSYFLMSKHVLPGMLEARKGVIINIGSVQGCQSQVGIPAYAASKGAINSLTRQMAMDYSNRGIRTVCVSPGTIRTPLVERLVIEDGQTCEFLGAKYPLGKMGDPSDIANLCLFLASDLAKNITGADIMCDGGIMAMGSWDHRVGLEYFASKL